METTQRCCLRFWTNPGSSTLCISCCMVSCTSHLAKHSGKMSKTCWALLEKQRITYDRRSLIDTLIYQSWSTSKKLTFIIRCCLEDLPNVKADGDGWRERVKGICAVNMPWYCYWWWEKKINHHSFILALTVFKYERADFGFKPRNPLT